MVKYKETQAVFGKKGKERWLYFLSEQNKGKDGREHALIHNLVFILLSGHRSLPHEKGIVDLKPK